jgi:altronate dehydratase small subunit
LPKALICDDSDNVVTLLGAAWPGDSVSWGPLLSDRILSSDEIPLFHKMAIKDIKQGDKIVKYGNVMGTATEHIKKGCYVHTHNVVSGRARECNLDVKN